MGQFLTKRDLCMKGSIYTSEKCPLCGGALHHSEDRGGLFCDKHPDQRAQSKFRVIFDRHTKRRFDNYPEAIRFLTHLRAQVDEDTYDPRDYRSSRPLGFETCARQWLELKETEVKRNSYRDIERTMERAIDAWGQVNVKVIDYGKIEDFLFKNLQVGDKTRANCRSHLHAFFVWLSRRKGIPVPDMPHIKFELGWREIIPLDVQARIVDWVQANEARRAWLGIKWLTTYVAIRPGELRNLRERDIDVEGAFVIPSPKEKVPKIVPMLDEDVALYHETNEGAAPMPDLYFFRHEKGNGAAAPGDRYSRDYLYRVWKRACAALGVEGVDLYGGTRHSTTSALGAHFSAEELQAHGTMHHTNKAFQRYMQHKAEPSRHIYEKARELAGRGEVVELRKRRREHE